MKFLKETYMNDERDTLHGVLAHLDSLRAENTQLKAVLSILRQREQAEAEIKKLQKENDELRKKIGDTK